MENERLHADFLEAGVNVRTVLLAGVTPSITAKRARNRIYSKARSPEGKEKDRLRWKRWKAANREYERERKKAWRDQNRERVRAYDRAYYARSPRRQAQLLARTRLIRASQSSGSRESR